MSGAAAGARGRRGASPRAVLFDFDGLLADTEAWHFETFVETLAVAGLELRPEHDTAYFLGMQDRDCFERAFADAGRHLDAGRCEELIRHKGELFGRGLGRVKLFPGVRACVEAACARGRVALASGSRRRDIEAVLAGNGLRASFEVLVTADDGTRSKPDPECLLLALERLRARGAPELEPADCLVFEDSARGVEAARRAGMRCVAVTNSAPAEALTLADRVLSSLTEWRWDEPG